PPTIFLFKRPYLLNLLNPFSPSSSSLPFSFSFSSPITAETIADPNRRRRIPRSPNRHQKLHHHQWMLASQIGTASTTLIPPPLSILPPTLLTAALGSEHGSPVEVVVRNANPIREIKYSLPEEAFSFASACNLE
ncbi:unnamed protein product, partial [Linum tenue]